MPISKKRQSRLRQAHPLYLQSYQNNRKIHCLYTRNNQLGGNRGECPPSPRGHHRPVLEKSHIPEIRRQFEETLLTFPEYQRDISDPSKNAAGDAIVYTLGGFAALGNPASFHNPLVRRLRLAAKEACIPLFREMINNMIDSDVREDTKLEMLFDRMMYRQQGQSPVAESWHRDIVPVNMIEDNDEIFGGFINLDTSDQYFSCIPGSHLGIRQKDITSEGFAQVPESDISLLAPYACTFSCPPGHMIIFPQYIIHEVIAKKAPYKMMRLFTGWRLTVSPNFLHPDLKKRMETQDIIPLPGGMLPPMYSMNHSSQFLRKPFHPIPYDEEL